MWLRQPITWGGPRSHICILFPLTYAYLTYMFNSKDAPVEAAGRTGYFPSAGLREEVITVHGHVQFVG